MSFMRSAIPVAMAVGFGIFNAQYILKPALQDEARKRDQQAMDQGAAEYAATAAPAAAVKAPASQPPAKS